MPTERDEKAAGEGRVRIVNVERQQVGLRLLRTRVAKVDDDDGNLPGQIPGNLYGL